MNKTLTLYHGSSLILKRPKFGKGNPFHDYGLGFYCTETLEVAKEWACSMAQDGFVNRWVNPKFCVNSICGSNRAR